MKTFFLSLVFNPDFEGKLFCTLPQIVYAAKAHITGAGRATGIMLTNRGGVLEDVLGLEDVLEDTI